MNGYWSEYDWYEDEDEFYEFDEEQTASYEYTGGCLPGILPLLAVILVSFLLAFAAFNWTSPVVAISITRASETSLDNTEQFEDQAEITQLFESSKLSPVFTKEVLYWENLILEWADYYQIDPNLVATVMQIESCGDPQALSSAGAMGLFQVMPYHFASGEDPYNPEINAIRGMAYLAKALTARQGDSRLALASYNGGITGASRPESMWADETHRYAYWGSGIYADAKRGSSSSERLSEWLQAGGNGLCKQASQRLGF